VNLEGSLWQGLLANLAAVALLTLIWVHLMQWVKRRFRRFHAAIFGLFMGVGAIIVMNMPFVAGSGFRMDHRFTLVGVSAFFGGPIALLITAGIISAYRIYLGGMAAIIGLTGIGIASGIGLIAHYLTRNKPRKIWHVLLLSAAIPIGVGSGLFLLPPALWPTARPDIAIPLMATVFMATLTCALAILQEDRRIIASDENAVYKAIISALPDCLNVKDTQGRFIAVNPATAALMRASQPEEMIGRTDFDFYSIETATAFRRDEELAQKEQHPTTIEQCIERDDGSKVYLSTLKVALRDIDGTLLGLITHNRDITEKRVLEHDLYQVRQTLDDAITNMNDGLAIFRDGKLIFCNDQYRNHFPLSGELRVPGAKLTDIMQASLARGERLGNPDVDRRWLGSISGDQFATHEDVLTMSDGRWLQIKSVSVKGGVLFLVSDITETKRAQAELESSAREYRALFEHSVAGIFRSSVDGKMLRANPALVRLNGFTTEAELISAVNDIAQEWYVDPDRRAEFVRLMAADGRVTDFVSEVYRFHTRERIWISETAWTVTDAHGEVICYEGAITEVTDRKHAELELKKANTELVALSTTDALTGLANRRAFDDCLALEFERARGGSLPLSVLLIDVDHFKRFNDSYGHIKGDEYLRFIAKVVLTIPQNYGDRACRYGGEELGVILPDTDSAEAHRLAEKLRAGVNGLRIAHASSDEGVVTVSIGVVTMAEATAFTSPSELVEIADKALYLAKKEGRNRVVLSKVA
jgi:diguanylate cyclase (GGDEF)-like protein/PAS domain S-box-containing protein